MTALVPYDVRLDEHCNNLVDEQDKVVGELYLITNKVTKKLYVGQTRSHRLNHGRYRPFGYIGRFKDHTSQAKTGETKKHYILNAIRKYGAESFEICLITKCALDKLDNLEEYYIEQYNSLYPNGYNMTLGGKSAYVPLKRDPNTDKIEFDFVKQYRDHQTPVTRQKISAALKECFKKPEMRQVCSSTAMTQHMRSRMQNFAGCVPDASNLEKHISESCNYTTGRITFNVSVDGKTTSFYSVRETNAETKQRAINFLKMLCQQHDQIAGTP